MSFKTSIKPYYKIPKRMRKQPTLTISDINKYTPNDTKLKSRIVGIEAAYEGNTPKFLEGWTTYRFQTRNVENKNQYKLVIYSPTPKVTLDTKVIVDSPNPLHVFRYEYALAKRGNAYIYRSNGNPPVQTNPNLKPGVDHHIYRCLRYLINNTTKNGLKAQRKLNSYDTEQFYRDL